MLFNFEAFAPRGRSRSNLRQGSLFIPTHTDSGVDARPLRRLLRLMLMQQPELRPSIDDVIEEVRGSLCMSLVRSPSLEFIPRSCNNKGENMCIPVASVVAGNSMPNLGLTNRFRKESFDDATFAEVGTEEGKFSDISLGF